MQGQQCLQPSGTNARALRLEDVCLGTVILVRIAQRDKPERQAGERRGGGPPGPIPNPAVKPICADDTALVGAWESRSLPAFPSRLSPSVVVH